MAKASDLVGLTFSRLTVLERVGTNKSRHALWLCKCQCGEVKTTTSYDLKRGHVRSCGCLHKETVRNTGKRNRKHGGKNTRLYRIWGGMKSRCLNKNHERWADYGGRGITICSRWLNSFENFSKDMKESHDAHVKIHGEWQTTLERVDNNKGYDPSNCRWATRAEQNRNQSKHYKIRERGAIS